jgi:hypothetical protein
LNCINPCIMQKLFKIVVLALLFSFLPGPSSAAEPGWSAVVVATGPYRRKLQATPIEKRPYRPLHFYGNAVRRRYHRGTALPLPRSVTSSRTFSSLNFLP